MVCENTGAPRREPLSISLLETLLRDSPVAMEYLAGPEHRVQFVNTAFARIAARRGKANMLGCTIAEIWPEVADVFVPLLDRVYQTGQPHRSENLPVTVEDETGQRQYYYTFSYTPIWGEGGQVVGILDQVFETTASVRERQVVEVERDRLQALIDSIEDEVWFCDPQGNIMLVNEQALHGLGLDISSSPGGTRLKPDILDRLEILRADGTPRPIEEAPLLRALSGEHPHDEEIVRNPRTGEMMYRHFRAAPVRAPDGQIQGAVTVIRDITDLKAVERSLRESEARFRSVLESSLDAVYRRDMQTDTYDYMSPVIEQILGFTPAEMNTMAMDKVLDRIHPDDLPGLQEKLAAVLETGKDRLVYRFKAKNGMYRWVADYVSVIPDEQGNPRYRGGILRDITSLKEAEAALLESEKRYRQMAETAQVNLNDLEAVIETMNEAVIISGPFAGPVRLNQAFVKLHGYTSKEAVIRDLPNWPEIIDMRAPDGRLVTPAEWPATRAFQGEVVLNEELHGLRRDTGRRWVGIYNSAPVKNAAGDTTLYITTVFDITARKQAEEEVQRAMRELERSNDELEQFASFASHDLREPLRKIKNFSDLLRRGLKGRLAQNEDEVFNRILSAEDRMETMIEDLLALARVKTREKPFSLVKLNRILEDVLSDMEGAIQRSGGEVHVGPLPAIQADPVQMRQLLQNLMGNGLKFRRPGERPVVRISGEIVRPAGEPRDMLALTVEDNGIGFDEQQFERIMQPFQRLHGRSQYEGSGIGLAICKRIVERHHGQITARSTPGQGAAFTVLLPLKQT